MRSLQDLKAFGLALLVAAVAAHAPFARGARAQNLGPDFGAHGGDHAKPDISGFDKDRAKSDMSGFEKNAGSIELIDPKTLRVCADPNNLPFSNDRGEGFENKIAQLLAQKLGKELAYAYYPGATGFVRNTLNAHLCDVILGMPQGNDLVQPTNPYYRTSYAIVARARSDLADIKSLDDPRLKEKGRRIGLVANTPPGNILAANGLLGAVKPYALMVDTRVESPSAEMIRDLKDGKIDIAVLWGPFAGYYAKKADGGLVVAPIEDAKGARMSFRIGFGVRRSDQNWKRELNQFIAQNQGALEEILADYGVPLLGGDGRAQRPRATP